MPFTHNFFKSPTALHELGLSCHEISVLSYLIRLCGTKDTCYPRQDTIAQHAGMSVAKVKNVLTYLRDERGYISWRNTNRSNSYLIHAGKIQDDAEYTRKPVNTDSYGMAIKKPEADNFAEVPIAAPDESVPQPNQTMNTADQFFNDIKQT